ncbi:MAG: lamin tail domain-containing protein, partial [Candidatus Paceibacterota bacterium]
MKLYNLLNGAILTLLLVCFLVAPQKVLAVDFNFFDFIGEDNYKVLSEFEGKKILQNFPDILYDKWVLLRGNGYSNPMEETTLCLLKYVSTLSMWNYLFRDLPMDVSFNIAKESVDIARLVGTEDTSGILAKIEKGTVDIAVNYLKEYLSKGQIKVSFGAMEMKYKDGNKEIENPLQYIIMYKRIDDKRSKVVARIYSPKAIVPPASRGSLGMVLGFSSSLNPGEKLSPFIVEINGIMDDGLYGSYFWDKDNTIIKTIFPEVVPDFGLKPKTWQQKYIIDPVKGIIDSFSGVFKSFTGSENNLTEYIFKDTANQEAIDKEVEAMSEGKAIEEDYPVKEIKNNIEEKKKETVKEEKKEVVKEEKKKEEVEVKIVPVLCSKSNQSVSSYDVIINEVAWMGSKNSANDEWIELKNTSNSGINLKGWTLRDGEDQINIVFEDITVSKGGFLLLERTDDNSVPTKTADLIYKGALSNSEEELYLFDSNCSLKDFVSGNPEWTAGDSSNKKTMERNDDLSGWHTYSGSGSNNIWGTPKENNSIVNKETAVVVVASSGGFSSGMTYGGDPVINYCSQTNLSVPNTSKVIINEVAWMGNNSDANDEWIELKNVSSEAVNLNNWQLLDAGNIRIILDSAATINPQGFYLLERTNDDSVPNIQMNKEYVGALSNSSESLRLFDSSCQLMDEVLANPDWPGGDNELKKTMERDADLSGWHTYSPEVVDTLSGLWGTPKAENSLKIVIEEQEEEEEEKEEDDDPEDNPPINNNSNHLLITEIGTGEGGGAEYVELYNQTESLIELCPSEESCSYLSYYSPASEWYDPSRNWKFPSGATINPNSYYIIDIFGNTG